MIGKILMLHETFANDRFLMQMSLGPMPVKALMRSMKLLATGVAPAARKAIGAKGFYAIFFDLR